MLYRNDRPLLRQLMLLIFVGTILCSHHSCKELVQDEFPDFLQVPTVNSYIIADSIIKLNISLADKLDSLPLTTVDNADVELYIDGEFGESLTSKGRAGTILKQKLRLDLCMIA